MTLVRPGAGAALRANEALEVVARAVCFAALAMPLLLLVVLFGDALLTAWPRLGWDFLTNYPSRRPEVAGVLPALAGSTSLIVLTMVMAVPVGLGAALYLEEYARPGRLTAFIEVNIANLAGVPSIIYGLLGLEIFVRILAFGRSLLAGAATLALLLLPMIIIASREALRTVPPSLREAGFALGGDRWRTLRLIVLPMCAPGVLTGAILAVSRAIGETAPLIVIGALSYVAFLPDSLLAPFAALPVQIFNWISRPQSAFHVNAAAGIVVLMALMLSLNGTAIWLRIRFQTRRG